MEPTITPITPHRRRPWVTIVILAIGLAVLGSAIGFAVTVMRYDPLEEGNSGGTPNISVPFQDVEGDFSSGLPDRRIVTYVQGATVPVMFSLSNRGPWAVTILDVEPPPSQLRLFTVTDLLLGVPNRCCADFAQFQPFVLAPGDRERPVVLIGVMTGCGNFDTDALYGWDSYDVRYRFAGVTHTRRVRSRWAVQIHVPANYRCTEPRGGLPEVGRQRLP